jgi:hypothetical protein
VEDKLSMNKTFAIVLACEKYRHKMLSQDTSKLGDYMYFMGDPTLSSPLVKDKVVYLPCPDNYESLTIKTLMAVKWAVENKQFDLLIKTDDDVRFLEGFDKIVNEASVHDYSGYLRNGGYMSDWHFNKCDDPKLNNLPFKVPEVIYCNGPLYFLSKKSASLLVDYGFRDDYCIYEDAEVGELLRRSGIIARQIQTSAGVFFSK